MDTEKLASGAAALEYVQANAVLGVGTGSTVNAFIAQMAAKKHFPAAALSSSVATTERLQAIGIEVLDANSCGPFSVYIDGADECDPQFHLIKGGGAALTREKILAEAADIFVCLIDASKQVSQLGKFPLPIEVIPMARSLVARKVLAIAPSAAPVWRQKADSSPVITDNGNWIIDVHGLQIADPVALENALNQVPGVVTVGLFARRGADVVICNGKRLHCGRNFEVLP
jgi:ribose 5-phosphate isomerase A